MALQLRENVYALEDAMRSMPQIELETHHHFADNMYARVMLLKAGTILVGKVHKKEHFFIIAKGRIQVTTDDGVKELSAGDLLIGTPGTKRAGVALEDTVCINVHRTKKRNLDKIEAQLIEPDARALLDSSNKVKELPCLGVQ